jgi:hypothetical protein
MPNLYHLDNKRNAGHNLAALEGLLDPLCYDVRCLKARNQIYDLVFVHWVRNEGYPRGTRSATEQGP